MYRILLAFGLVLFSFPSWAEEDEVKMWTPAFKSMECTPTPASLMENNSPINPQKISFSELIENISKYHCTWVELTVFFRSDRYYEYSSTFYASQKAYYELEGSYNRRDNSMFVESYFENRQPPFHYQNINLKISGFFYDLCLEQEAFIKGQPGYKEGEFIWHFGPCHYSKVHLLKDVVIIEEESPSFQYLTDELSNSAYGNLVPFPEEYGDLNLIRRNATDYLSYLQKKDFEGLLEALNLSEEDKQKERTMMKENPTSFVGMYFLEDASPLDGITLEKTQYKVLAWKFDSVKGPVIRDEHAIACFCLDGSCEGKWPIKILDVDSPSFPFICVWMDKKETEGGEVDWAWWYDEETVEEE